MNFEDLKIIWDSKTNERLYLINESVLHAGLRQKTRVFDRKMRWQEIQSYGSSALVIAIAIGLLAMSFSANPEEQMPVSAVLALLLATACWMYFIGFIYLGRERQDERERRFDASLREELERDLSQLDYQIRLRKHIMLHYLPPHVGGFLMLWVVFGLNGDGLSVGALLLIALLQAAALVFEGLLQRRLILREMLPRKRELESLREKLG